MISSNSLIFLKEVLTSNEAGQEFASAIENGSLLSEDTMYRLTVAMADPEIAQNIQDAIVGLSPLSEREVNYLYYNFGSASVAADIASNVVGGYVSGAGRALPLSMPASVTQTVATPSFSPQPGTYNEPSKIITVSSVTQGVTMYYTTNGSTPTTGSTLYTGPITVSSSQTLKVLAVKSGMTDSAIGSAAYVVNGAVATPTFDPVAGPYVGTQNVTIASATVGATIYYTVDGSTPTIASSLYSAPVEVAASLTLKALAVKANFADSAVGSAAYVIS